jgi:hypothetical protein
MDKGRNCSLEVIQVKAKHKSSKEKSQGMAGECSDSSAEDVLLELGIELSARDEWLLNFEVNDKGIGRILLPPTLSALLQSDRICIVPSAGGLYIRSISEF